MTRSRRRTPIIGFTTAGSERRAKRFASRALRRRIRVLLRRAAPPDVLPTSRELSDCWAWPKDGRQRFDPGRFPALLRK